MEETNGSGRVQRDIGMLRGEMSGVQKDIARVETKVDQGFDSLRLEIQSLKDTRSFARGISYLANAIIAAAVSATMVILAWVLKR